MTHEHVDQLLADPATRVRGMRAALALSDDELAYLRDRLRELRDDPDPVVRWFASRRLELVD